MQITIFKLQHGPMTELCWGEIQCLGKDPNNDKIRGPIVEEVLLRNQRANTNQPLVIIAFTATGHSFILYKHRQ